MSPLLFSMSFSTLRPRYLPFFFFFNDTATTEIYTLSLHDALPISQTLDKGIRWARFSVWTSGCRTLDRKSTRLNSSHVEISYAVFCLKKKKKYERVVEKLHIASETYHSTVDKT